MKTLLVLNIRPELEEDLVDYLLAREGVAGFTSYHARGHGLVNEELSLAEQVSGRRKRLQFEILMDEADVNLLIDGLADEVGRDIVFWQQVVSNAGRVD
ncbi:MAG: DUF3240 family protein [Gammaproteobacteria bacterium]|nr:DUF3240 family protein [Gammaproteobacteria bacterium]